MFIPMWIIHSLVTAVFLLIVGFWGLKTESDWDFSPIFKVPICAIGYLIYWLIMK